MGPVFDYLGRDVYTGEDCRLGEVTNVVTDPVYKTVDYLVIALPMGRDVVVPIDVIRDSGDRLVVPFGESFAANAPTVDLEDGFDVREKVSLDNYYLRRAA
jgi:hypothetical protein